MARINDSYLKLQAGYLFPEIGRRVREFTDANPTATVIRLGIGDVTLPLAPAVLKAFHDGVDDMAKCESFHGYGPEQGYGWLSQVIIDKAYKPLGVDLKTSEVFISDGSKCDCANILDIFDLGNKVAICDPVYPVYNDTNVMVGRTGQADDKGYYEGIHYMPCTGANNFTPSIPHEKVDVIYLCSPNNPTGAVATKETLKNGSITPWPTTLSSSLMPPTRPSSQKRTFPIRSMKSKVRAIVPLSSVPSPRLLASPVCVAVWLLFLKS